MGGRLHACCELLAEVRELLGLRIDDLLQCGCAYLARFFCILGSVALRLDRGDTRARQREEAGGRHVRLWRRRGRDDNEVDEQHDMRASAMRDGPHAEGLARPVGWETRQVRRGAFRQNPQMWYKCGSFGRFRM